jgi:hypothetical protein
VVIECSTGKISVIVNPVRKSSTFQRGKGTLDRRRNDEHD